MSGLDDVHVREAIPVAARGNNLLLVTPPAAAYAGPLVAALIGRDRAAGPALDLLLCPTASLEPWADLTETLARAAGLRAHTAHGPARAARLLRAGTLDVLVTIPTTALALLQRSALDAGSIRSVLLATPEGFDPGAGEALTALMQDLPKPTQRVFVTSTPERIAELTERYAWRAAVFGVSAPGTPAAAPAGPVRTVSVGWRDRPRALAALLETLDCESLLVWAADATGAAAAAAALPAQDPACRTCTGEPDGKADTVVAFDPPSPERLRQLLALGEVVLLVPPGAEGWTERIAAPRRPLRLPGGFEAAADRAARERETISRAIGAADHDTALLTLAPLFDRHEATAVAAGLYRLWTAAPVATPVSAAAEAPSVPVTSAVARAWVGIGKKDNVTPNDLVAVLTKELGVSKEKIGKVDIREMFTLVELPANEVEKIAAGLNGKTIRRRRVVAKVDAGGRGPERQGAARRGGSRGKPAR